MNIFKDFDGDQIELTKFEAFETKGLVYLAMETKLFGSYLLRTLEAGEYVSHYPGRIYRFNDQEGDDKHLLLLERNENFDALVNKAASYKQTIDENMSRPRSRLFPIRRRSK